MLWKPVPAQRPTRLGRGASIATLMATLAVGVSGCVGLLGSGEENAAEDGEDAADGADGSGGGALGDGDGGGAVSGKEEEAMARLPLRRLTPFEIDRALQDLLGDSSHAALALQPERTKSPFETEPSQQLATRQILELLEGVLEQVATAALSDVPAQLGCEPQEAGDGCVASFVERLGRRAFRRSLTGDEVERFVSLQRSLEPSHGRTGALVKAVQAILLSPDFLYLTALGGEEDPSGDVPLQAHELAGRMAFFLWGSVPDEELLVAAEGGELASEAGVEAQARRMLAHPRAAGSAARFFAGWLEVINLRGKPKTDPQWTSELVLAVERETIEVVEDWFRAGGSVDDLLTSDTTKLNGTLAAFYGVPDLQGASFVEVTGMEEHGRGGLLGHASFLATHAMQGAPSPTLRGKWFVERALCTPIGAPPMDALSKAPELVEGMTNREWHELIQRTSPCNACHDQMEPPGFLFEGFDAVGRVRTHDAGKPVDTEATLMSEHQEFARTFADYRGLQDVMGESEVVRHCISTNWLEYATARVATSADEESLADITEALETSGEEAVVAIVATRQFRTARPAGEE